MSFFLSREICTFRNHGKRGIVCPIDMYMCGKARERDEVTLNVLLALISCLLLDYTSEGLYHLVAYLSRGSRDLMKISRD